MKTKMIRSIFVWTFLSLCLNSSVFADDLHIPLSFELAKNGIYVSEQPDLTDDCLHDSRHCPVHEIVPA